MAAPLRDTWDKDANRLVSTLEGDNSATAIKAARTRWQNSHRAYWRAARAAWRDIQQGKKGSPAEIAEAHGVELFGHSRDSRNPRPRGDTVRTLNETIIGLLLIAFLVPACLKLLGII